MRAGQTLVADDGYEVMLFPLIQMYMSQDELENVSHQNTWNMDFLGWNNGRVLKQQYYAPCTCKLVNTWGGEDHGRIWESLDYVHCADGVLRKVHFIFMHDEEDRPAIGTIRRQGEPIGKTGKTINSTGDHVHICVGYGAYDGMAQRNTNPNQWDLNKRLHIYNVCYVNDTPIKYVYGGHTWRTYSGPVFNPNKHKFKWVLYAKKLRNRNFN